MLWEQLSLMKTVSCKAFPPPSLSLVFCLPLSSQFVLFFPQHNGNKLLSLLSSTGGTATIVTRLEGAGVRALLRVRPCMHVWVCGPHACRPVTVRAHVAFQGNNNHGIWLPVPSPPVIDESNIYSVTLCVVNIHYGIPSQIGEQGRRMGQVQPAGTSCQFD